MNLELVSAIAAVGTFVVIAASALAAMVQLRHMRSSNQITAINGMQEVIESEEFRAARRFLQDELPRLEREPKFAARVEHRILDDGLLSFNIVGNIFENLGAFCKYGLIDKEIACDLFSGPVLSSWNAMMPTIALRRRSLDAPALLENFEYLAVLCEDFEARHPDGAYPRGARRMRVEEPQTIDTAQQKERD